MTSTIATTISDFADILFDSGSFYPYWLGEIPVIRNDSEDNAYRNLSNGGRIDFYNLIASLEANKRICQRVDERWTMTVKRYYEAKANENHIMKVAEDMDVVIDYIESSLGFTFGGVFEHFDYGEISVSIEDIGNSRVYVSELIITGQKARAI